MLRAGCRSGRLSTRESRERGLAIPRRALELTGCSPTLAVPVAGIPWIHLGRGKNHVTGTRMEQLIKSECIESGMRIREMVLADRVSLPNTEGA